VSNPVEIVEHRGGRESPGELPFSEDLSPGGIEVPSGVSERPSVGVEESHREAPLQEAFPLIAAHMEGSCACFTNPFGFEEGAAVSQGQGANERHERSGRGGGASRRMDREALAEEAQTFGGLREGDLLETSEEVDDVAGVITAGETAPAVELTHDDEGVCVVPVVKRTGTDQARGRAAEGPQQPFSIEDILNPNGVLERTEVNEVRGHGRAPYRNKGGRRRPEAGGDELESELLCRRRRQQLGWALLVWRSVRPLGAIGAPPLDVDDMSPLHQAVDEGRGQGGVAQRLPPLVDAEIAGEDEGMFVVTGIDEVEEERRILGPGREMTQVVDDEQIDAAQTCDEGIDAMVGQSGIKGRQELSGRKESDRVSLEGSEVTEGNREMGFAGPRLSQEENGPAL